MTSSSAVASLFPMNSSSAMNCISSALSSTCPPPLLELEVAWSFGIDLGVEVVLIAPDLVGRVKVLEVGDEPYAIELAVAEVAGERCEPASSQQPTRVAHGVLAARAGPIGERRAGDDNGAEELWPHRREQHDRPARLAIADHGRLAIGFGMKRDDTFEERCFRVDHVLYGLSGDRFGEKAHEIARMAAITVTLRTFIATLPCLFPRLTLVNLSFFS